MMVDAGWTGIFIGVCRFALFYRDRCIHLRLSTTMSSKPQITVEVASDVM